ncbi:MAG: hypothetical protein U9Q15_00500 [Patescibacteria group bacterium]|nr:hypothetical protein [Patescibacteria group bacterium]
MHAHCTPQEKLDSQIYLQPNILVLTKDPLIKDKLQKLNRSVAFVDVIDDPKQVTPLLSQYQYHICIIDNRIHIPTAYQSAWKNFAEKKKGKNITFLGIHHATTTYMDVQNRALAQHWDAVFFFPPSYYAKDHPVEYNYFLHVFDQYLATIRQELGFAYNQTYIDAFGYRVSLSERTLWKQETLPKEIMRLLQHILLMNKDKQRIYYNLLIHRLYGNTYQNIQLKRHFDTLLREVQLIFEQKFEKSLKPVMDGAHVYYTIVPLQKKRRTYNAITQIKTPNKVGESNTHPQYKNLQLLDT